MAGFVGISTPSIIVGNETIGIVPNSFNFVSGNGTKTVRTQSNGGNSVDLVVTEDAETKKSMIKFELFPTKSNIDLLGSWQELTAALAVEATDQKAGFGKTFSSMTVTNDPEQGLTQDGKIAVEMEGAPAR